MTDSELRAEAHELMDKYLDNGGSTELVIMARNDYSRNSLSSSQAELLQEYHKDNCNIRNSLPCTCGLYALLNTQLTAERTAIKALLPKKDHLPDGVTPVEIAKRLDDFNRGRNSVIDQVTQVIDGREGV